MQQRYIIQKEQPMPVQFTERELATMLAALRYWQQDLAESDGPISEHFNEYPPLTVEEIDELCEWLNGEATTA
jgi:hypothetical protein